MPPPSTAAPRSSPLHPQTPMSHTHHQQHQLDVTTSPQSRQTQSTQHTPSSSSMDGPTRTGVVAPLPVVPSPPGTPVTMGASAVAAAAASVAKEIEAAAAAASRTTPAGGPPADGADGAGDAGSMMPSLFARVSRQLSPCIVSAADRPRGSEPKMKERPGQQAVAATGGSGDDRGGWESSVLRQKSKSRAIAADGGVKQWAQASSFLRQQRELANQAWRKQQEQQVGIMKQQQMMLHQSQLHQHKKLLLEQRGELHRVQQQPARHEQFGLLRFLQQKHTEQRQRQQEVFLQQKQQQQKDFQSSLHAWNGSGGSSPDPVDFSTGFAAGSTANSSLAVDPSFSEITAGAPGAIPSASPHVAHGGQERSAAVSGGASTRREASGPDITDDPGAAAIETRRSQRPSPLGQAVGIDYGFTSYGQGVSMTSSTTLGSAGASTVAPPVWHNLAGAGARGQASSNSSSCASHGGADRRAQAAGGLSTAHTAATVGGTKVRARGFRVKVREVTVALL